MGALSLTAACKRSGDGSGEAHTKAHLLGQRLTGLLQIPNARMGLYKAVGTQFCQSGDATLIEYHIKKLDDHSPLGAALYGYVCISKGARNAQLFDGQDGKLARARRAGNDEKSTYEIFSDVGDACNLGSLGGNVLAQAKAYEKGFLENLTPWRRKLLLNVCSTTQGRELLPSAQFVRDVVSKGIVNESWKVLRTDDSNPPAGGAGKKGDGVLAAIWTNPAWGSWSVENLQDGTPLVHPAVLYMLPVIEEMRRRESSHSSTAPSPASQPSSNSANPSSPSISPNSSESMSAPTPQSEGSFDSYSAPQ